MENLNKQALTLSRIQLIADLSQTAQCNQQEFLMAMSLISDLAGQVLPQNHSDAVFYNVIKEDRH
ncbi:MULTISPECIES: hypothetical protein [Yersiniaceae]|uniref:Uncharacterized protein n=1 Tax=Nissabacter archeti TaxID=1917880 RepID=A0ABS5JGB2_9GAMM|nr:MULTISPECIES: hypothetical protein [Yersiniaceae]MBS0969014.1 hypothetical protein [Nissabacter archeti]MDV5142724.1 hypothetical protein [Chimaeribacter arupi]DAI62227.1 MAG TPA: hypothetical protein [Caudoviricetes sp.]